MKSVIVLLSLLSFSTCAPQGFGFGDFINAVADDISGNYDEPPYNVVSTFSVDGKTIEERNYEGGKKWACNKRIVSNDNEDDGMFMMLFRYISGANAGAKKIKMTIPVSTKWTPLANGNVEKEMCFYLDEKHQSSPPEPTNSQVYIVTRPAMTVFTRRVSGYMDDEDWEAEAQTLDTLIGKQGYAINREEFYTNGYNSPMQFWNRRNEVWKVKV